MDRDQTEFEKFKQFFHRIDKFNMGQVKELERMLNQTHPENLDVKTACTVRNTALKMCKIFTTQNAIIREALKD